jgi:ribosome-associated protein
MIRVTPRIFLDETELVEEFMRASGPGGQNVNKVETAVRLRFDARNSPNLPDPVRARLMRLAGNRLTKEGVVVVEAQRARTQERNRAEARARLFDLIRDAAAPPPPPRVATKPTYGSKLRRLEGKKRRGDVKALRGGSSKDRDLRDA